MEGTFFTFHYISDSYLFICLIFSPHLNLRNRLVTVLAWKLRKLWEYAHIKEAGIKGFFDNIDHNWMIGMLEERINLGN